MTILPLEKLKTLILDFQERSIETGVPRRFSLKAVPGKAAVCIGVRRGGKSTYLFQIIRKLQEKGVSPQNILYLNFFDDRLHGLTPENFGLIIDAWHSLHPEKRNRETLYCFFDEIQARSGWEPFVERLLRTEKCEIYLTGSSARMLSREIATQMRGRSLAWELFPFSFREFLDARNIKSNGPLSSRKQLQIRKAFEEYQETGGFPEVLDLDRHLRIRTHQEYFQVILFRDLIERHDMKHPRAVSDLAHRLADNIASLHSINKLTGYLKSRGHRIPKMTVSNCMEWFEDAYFFFSTRLFDASLSRSQANPKKVYCIDHALVNSISSGILVNSGHLLENLVFTALRRLHPDLFYYRTRNGREVDFVVPGFGENPGKALIQACESTADPATRKREVTALEEAMQELELDTGTIVTKDEEDRMKVPGGNIRIVPAWRFLLDLPDP